MKKTHMYILMVFILFFMMSCEKEKERSVLQIALDNASTSNQVGFRISYDVFYSGKTTYEYNYDNYLFNHPFYVHFAKVTQSDMSQMLIKRDETFYVINEVDGTYYQSSGPSFMEDNPYLSLFDLLEEAKLISTSVYETYALSVPASQLESSLKMIKAIESYVATYMLEKNDHEVEDFLIDVLIKVRKKGEIHSIIFDFKDYLNEAFELEMGRTFERAWIEYFYLPGAFTPEFNETTDYLIDDHANHKDHNPLKVSLNKSFTINLQYRFDIDIVAFELLEHKEITISITDTFNHFVLYNDDDEIIANLHGMTSILLEPGTYYIFAIGSHSPEEINITISA